MDYPNLVQMENGTCSHNTTTDDLKKYYGELLKNAQGTIIITIPKEKLEQSESEIIKSLSVFPAVKPMIFQKFQISMHQKTWKKNYVFLTPHASSDNVIIEKNIKNKYKW